jgi:hypothetical protein
MTTATIRILDIEPASGGHQMVRFKHAGVTWYWLVEDAGYEAGQTVAVHLPDSPDGQITPVDGPLLYAGHVTPRTDGAR